MKFIYSLMVAIVLPTFAYADALDACSEHVRYGAPSHSGDLLCRTAYALSHNPVRKTADWVAYHLTAEHVHGTEKRSGDFRPDTDLAPNKRAELSDYKGSGYDRGHMAPAAAMNWSPQVMSESFLLSNMAPQVGNKMNRGIWRILEEKVRNWTDKRTETYVVTGNIYDKNPPDVIGSNKVAVPTHCYKVIFDPVRVEAIAFIVPNTTSEVSELPNFIVSVDEVEQRTGLDFLSELDDQVENIVESKVQPAMWAE